MESKEVTPLLDNDGKMTSDYKLLRYFLEAITMYLAIIESFLFYLHGC